MIHWHRKVYSYTLIHYLYLNKNGTFLVSGLLKLNDTFEVSGFLKPNDTFMYFVLLFLYDTLKFLGLLTNSDCIIIKRTD
jgi:uncharacterized membrane protein